MSPISAYIALSIGFPAKAALAPRLKSTRPFAHPVAGQLRMAAEYIVPCCYLAPFGRADRRDLVSEPFPVRDAMHGTKYDGVPKHSTITVK